MIQAPRRGQGDDAPYMPPPASYEEEPEGARPKKKAKYVPKDQYALPALEGSLQDKVEAQAEADPRVATEAEWRDFLDDLRPEDLDIESPMFADLPTELKYEIIGDLRCACLPSSCSTISGRRTGSRVDRQTDDESRPCAIRRRRSTFRKLRSPIS